MLYVRGNKVKNSTMNHRSTPNFKGRLWRLGSDGQSWLGLRRCAAILSKVWGQSVSFSSNFFKIWTFRNPYLAADRRHHGVGGYLTVQVNQPAKKWASHDEMSSTIEISVVDYSALTSKSKAQEPPWKSPIATAFVEAGVEMGYENRWGRQLTFQMLLEILEVLEMLFIDAN